MDPLSDCIAYWSDACRASGGTVDDGPTIRMRGPPGTPPVFGVLKFDGDAVEAVAEARNWMDGGGPFSFIARDEEMARSLRGAGMFESNQFRLMHRDVGPLGSPAHDVQWLSEATPFVQVLAEAQNIPPHGIDDAVRAINNRIESGDLDAAVIFDGKMPVGCAALYSGNGNAGLYNVGVVTSHRRRGIATSLVQARMALAADMELSTAVATTTPEGCGLLTSMGFRQVGTVRQLTWFPGPPTGP